MNIQEILSRAGLKVTHQRALVLEALIRRKNHPCVEELYADLKMQVHGLSKATLYNILEQFYEKGIVEKISTIDGKLRYDFKDQPHHHIHNIETGQIIDFYDETLSNILKEYFNTKQINNYEIIDVKVEIKGKPIKM
ncbi:MAG: transcriptional repressor [Bacteroidales bacterium]|nr:transcriptional repressor [Bacteroidales bacterium]